MKSLGTFLAGIIISAIILGIFALCGKFAEEDRAKYQCQTNDTYRVRSGVLPYMANPVHNWHPANINHVYHR